MVRAPALAPVMEVFASIQGEGAHVGEPQVFVRLRGCPLRCRWCDTPGSWRVPPDRPWSTPDEVARRVAAVEPGARRTVSVTGGEPLVWPEFVRALAPRLRPRRVHLETAAAHPRALARVLDAVDHVSLDLKLPDDLDPPEWDEAEDEPHPESPEAWREVRAEVLRLVAGRDACAKVLVAGGRTPTDFDELLDDVARLAPRVPVVVQPVTPMRDVAAPEPTLVLAVVEAGLGRGLAVRALPQVHRTLALP